jgi:hypothetical protein
MIMKPGICPQSEITFDKGKMYPKIVRFIGNKVNQPVADVGELNHKSQFLSQHYNVPITQIAPVDYYMANCVKYQTIFCFEVLSHLVNPLWFMRELSCNLEKNGVIYLSMPNRPRLLRNVHHFNEFGGKHLQRWILDDLGLQIVRTARYRNIYIPGKWYTHIGIRPLIRMIMRWLYNWIYIYEIRFKP